MAEQITSKKSEGLHLTEESVLAARRYQEDNEEFRGLPLRLYLEGKGCDGFYYGVTFDQAEERDLHFPHGGIDLVVDPETYQFCQGSEIEWIDDERGTGFLVNNPHQKKFRGKFFKRKVWQERLQKQQQTGREDNA